MKIKKSVFMVSMITMLFSAGAYAFLWSGHHVVKECDQYHSEQIAQSYVSYPVMPVLFGGISL